MDNSGLLSRSISSGYVRNGNSKGFVSSNVKAKSNYVSILAEDDTLLKKTNAKFIHEFVNKYGYYPNKSKNITPTKEEKGEMAVKLMFDELAKDRLMATVIEPLRGKSVISRVIFKAHIPGMPEKYGVRFEGGTLLYVDQKTFKYFEVEIEYKNQ